MTESRDRRDSASVSETALLEEIRAELNALEDIEPGEEVWARIQDRTRGQSAGADKVLHVRPNDRPNDRSSVSYMQPLAMAAGLVIAVAVGLLTVETFRPTTSTSISTLAVSAAAVDPALQALLQRSRELEPLVRNARYARSDSAERAFIYRIADVDSQLVETKPDGEAPSRGEVKKLWGQRVALLESLAEVRRARAVLRPAVY